MDLDKLLGELKNMDLGALMGQAQQVQGQVAEAQERAARREVVGEAGGGIVKVTANGRQEILRVDIDPIAVDPRDKEMLEDLLVAATNVALHKAKAVMAEELGPLAGMMQAGGVGL